MQRLLAQVKWFELQVGYAGEEHYKGGNISKIAPVW